MAQPNSEGMEVELAVVDFVDACQTIGVHPDEQRLQVIAGFDGAYYIMRFVAFGGAGSPLISGQSSSFLGSIGTVTVLPDARMEIYVDDPFVAGLGHTNATVAQAHGSYSLVFVTWARIVLGKSSEK